MSGSPKNPTCNPTNRGHKPDKSPMRPLRDTLLKLAKNLRFSITGMLPAQSARPHLRILTILKIRTDAGLLVFLNSSVDD